MYNAWNAPKRQAASAARVNGDYNIETAKAAYLKLLNWPNSLECCNIPGQKMTQSLSEPFIET